MSNKKNILPFELTMFGTNEFGLISKKSYPVGTPIYKSITHVRVDKEIVVTAIGGLIRHSKEPSCTVDIGSISSEMGADTIITQYILTPLFNLEPGDEITIDYIQTDREIYEMIQESWWEKDSAVVYTGIEGKINFQEQIVESIGGDLYVDGSATLGDLSALQSIGGGYK